MVIISQNGEVLVNLDRVAVILPVKMNDGKFYVLAGSELCYPKNGGIVLGTYSSMNRAQAALNEMLRYYEHEGMKGLEHTVFRMPEERDEDE